MGNNYDSAHDDRKISSVSFNSYDTVDSLSSINSNSLVYDSIHSNQVSSAILIFGLLIFLGKKLDHLAQCTRITCL